MVINLRQVARSTPLGTFFVLAYLWSWVWWIPAVVWYRAQGFGGPVGPIIAPVVIGAYGPTIAAIVTTGLTSDWTEVRRLLGKYLDIRQAPTWYLVALLAPCLITLAAIGWAARRGVDVGAFVASGFTLMPMALLAGLPFGPLAEELGWRGFALPRLVRQGSLVRASCIIGVAWTFWHAPLYWAPAGTSISSEHPTAVHVALYLAQVTGLSFLFTWLARHSNHSVVLAILLHLSFNASLPSLLFGNLGASSGSIGASPVDRQLVEIGIVPLWILVGVIVRAEGAAWWRRAEPSVLQKTEA